MKKLALIGLAIALFIPIITKQIAAQQNIKESKIKIEPVKTEPVKTEPFKTEPIETESTKDRIVSYFSNLMEKPLPLGYVLLIALIIGIMTSLTPCIYPMIPITVGLLQSQASKSVGRNFLLSTSYVTGMAVVYAILGYFAATTTLILGQWLANPWIVGLLILLFLYMAFSMFGFYEIYIPKFLQGGSNLKVRGSLLYSFLFGAVSGTAASPCISPAIFLLLGYVAKTGSPLIGFITLFTFAFGMGLLLITIGTFSTSLTTLPRAGVWMNEIKKFFGFLLVGVAIYFLQPFTSDAVVTTLNITLLTVAVCYYIILIIKKFKKK